MVGPDVYYYVTVNASESYCFIMSYLFFRSFEQVFRLGFSYERSVYISPLMYNWFLCILQNKCSFLGTPWIFFFYFLQQFIILSVLFFNCFWDLVNNKMFDSIFIVLVLSVYAIAQDEDDLSLTKHESWECCSFSVINHPLYCRPCPINRLYFPICYDNTHISTLPLQFLLECSLILAMITLSSLVHHVALLVLECLFPWIACGQDFPAHSLFV